MSLASAFTLSRLAADLTYDLSRAPEVPEQITVQCAVSRGKIMVLLESPNVDTVPEHYVFAQVETLIRHRLEIDGLPVEADHLGATGEPIPVKVYLKSRAQANPSAVHRFNWLVQDSSGPILLGDVALDDHGFLRLLEQLPVTPNHAYDGVVRFRSRAGKEGVIEGGRGNFGQLLCQFDSGSGGGLEETVIVGQFAHLCVGGLGQLFAAIAQVDAPQTGHGVEDFMAFGVPEIHPFGSGNYPGAPGAQ